MSAWKIAVRRLYQSGEPLTFKQLDMGEMHQSTMYTLFMYGLIESTGTRSRRVYFLTEKGTRFAEGKITFVRWGPYRSFFKATWLNALPSPMKVESNRQLSFMF